MHHEGEEIWVRLTGGGPYGLRFGGRGTRWEPLVVAKLHKKSKARSAGVRVGDVVLSINGNRCDVMTLQTASDLTDFSRDLDIQLLRSQTIQVLLPEAPSASSFRQHQQRPAASRSLAFSPFLSDPESSSSSSNLRPSQSTELFRHQVSHYQRQESPLTSADRRQHGLFDEETGDGEPAQTFGREGVKSKCQSDEVEESGGAGGSRRWQSDQSETGALWKAGRPEVKWAPKISDVPESQLENSECSVEVDGSIPGQMDKLQPFTPSSLLPKPSFSTRAKPDRWQPPSASHLLSETVTEPGSSRPGSSQPADAFFHEVVIWSSKPTEVEKLQGGDFKSHQKPLPWQPTGDPVRVDEAEESPTPARWQPSSHGNQPTPAAWQPTQPTPTDSRIVKTTGTSEQPLRRRPQPNSQTNESSTWQPPQLTVVKETENNQPSLWQLDNARASRQHKWQPTQQPVDIIEEGFSNSHRLQNHLEEPHRAPPDGSASPEVASLFLRRVVTDGSALTAGSGSDVEKQQEISYFGKKKKLYADSSFYEDPEHKYPTIEDQIRMARKVAILLTSPANENARGQKMFLKRKEQSSKWIVDPRNLIWTTPAPKLDSSTLSPVQVERMRLSGEKSLHDVIPFDVCSMLADELREEKGRGGRLFAKRRNQADKSTTPETNGLKQVPEPLSCQPVPNRKYVPQSNQNSVTETIARIHPPVAQQPRDPLDTPFQLPANRLKNMIDPPRAKITPWDSAVQYGTVEPAFEHLQGYRPPSYEAETVDLRSGSMSNQTGRSELKGQGHNIDQMDSFYKGVQSFSHDRTSTVGSSDYQQESYSYSPATGLAPDIDSSCFIRQREAAVYRPVRFQVGTRNFK